MAKWTALLLLAVTGCAPVGVFGGEGSTTTSAPETREFGFIRSVAPDALTIQFDPAEWLTGAAAQRAAEEDGVVPKGEGVPNDYYVRNPDQSTRVLKIRSDTRIRGAVPVTHLRPNGPPKGCGNCSRYPVSIEEFLAAFAPNGRGPQGKYWVNAQLHAVVAIEEQYTP